MTVKPAGKKIERLSLLSGGERSLAAVALLIAIFKARPSPFYIMDEVEAALDDANLGRLLTIFEGLRESTQLIVITHQKRTMEIADALYGVSMRQDGVSAVVGQRVQRRAASRPKPSRSAPGRARRSRARVSPRRARRPGRRDPPGSWGVSSATGRLGSVVRYSASASASAFADTVGWEPSGSGRAPGASSSRPARRRSRRRWSAR